MDKETQAFFKTVLLKRLDELYSEAEKTVAGMTDNEENFPDPTDRATLESDRNFVLRIRDRERKLIVKIREALQRIEEGHFGQCEECGTSKRQACHDTLHRVQAKAGSHGARQGRVDE
jgi:DnaK suppressor protein